MNPQDLLATTEQLAKTGAALSAALPFTALVKRMLGPAADEIAERVRDEIKLYRYDRQLAMLKKAEDMATAAGFTPKAVPIKPLFALLEGASLEENENLHTRWAALLANASNPATQALVRPTFMDSLKLMTPDTALFLDEVFQEAQSGSVEVSSASSLRSLTLVDLGTWEDLYRFFAKAGCTQTKADTLVTSESSDEEQKLDEDDRQHFSLVMDELTRFQMWSTTDDRNSGMHFYLSAYAAQFLVATQAPKANASAS